MVCKCRAHDVAFTVYPPGFVPYARRPLLSQGADDGDPSVEDIVRDAANGIAWAREAPGGTDRWWSLQCRTLGRAVKITGLDTSSDVRDAIAIGIGVPLSLLAQGSRAVGYRQRGAAVLAVIGALGEAPLERLLRAGALADCWGTPWRWDRSPPRLRCLALHSWRDTRKPSTNLEPRAPPPGR